MPLRRINRRQCQYTWVIMISTVDRSTCFLPQPNGQRHQFVGALDDYDWGDLLSLQGSRMDRRDTYWGASAAHLFIVCVGSCPIFWDKWLALVMALHGHLFPLALPPSALCDPDWSISLLWMFTLAIKFLRDSWVKWLPLTMVCQSHLLPRDELTFARI